MKATGYTIKRDKESGAYYVTDGLWASSLYTRAYAKKVLRDALWGSKGHDNRGTYAHKRKC